MTITLNNADEKQKTRASVEGNVKLIRASWGFGVQELRRTYGNPRELGAGARRAIHQFGDALERLAE